MAKVPEDQEIVVEEFDQEDQEMAELIATPFNDYVKQVNSALNQNLTIAENFKGAVQFLRVVGGQPTSFAYSKGLPVALWVGQVTKVNDNNWTPAGPVQAFWEYNGAGRITIKSITNLTVSDKYDVTLVVISG